MKVFLRTPAVYHHRKKMSVPLGPGESSPTMTLKANPISGLHCVVRGRAFRALTERTEGLKCIKSVDTESQELQWFHCFLLYWQETVRASWSLVLKTCRFSCLKGNLCLGRLVHHGFSCGDQLIKIIIWESKGTFMRNRYFSLRSSICSGNTSCYKRAAERWAVAAGVWEVMSLCGCFLWVLSSPLNIQEAEASQATLSLVSDSFPQDCGGCKQQEWGRCTRKTIRISTGHPHPMAISWKVVSQWPKGAAWPRVWQRRPVGHVRAKEREGQTIVTSNS